MVVTDFCRRWWRSSGVRGPAGARQLWADRLRPTLLQLLLLQFLLRQLHPTLTEEQTVRSARLKPQMFLKTLEGMRRRFRLLSWLEDCNFTEHWTTAITKRTQNSERTLKKGVRTVDVETGSLFEHWKPENQKGLYKRRTTFKVSWMWGSNSQISYLLTGPTDHVLCF